MAETLAVDAGSAPGELTFAAMKASRGDRHQDTTSRNRVGTHLTRRWPSPTGPVQNALPLATLKAVASIRLGFLHLGQMRSWTSKGLMAVGI
jgi:hypothetical protein